MYTLQEILSNQTTEILQFRLKLLQVKPEGTRKAELIDAIKKCYTGSGLAGMVASLGNLERQAVAEAVYETGGQYDKARVEAKYGAAPSFYNAPEKDRFDSWRYTNKAEFATRLNLLFFPVAQLGYLIPHDLLVPLKTLLPEPPEASVSTMEAPPEEAGITVRLTESEALADLTTLLHLAEKGELSLGAKTGIPSAAASQKILDCLSGGDFYPPEVALAPKKWSHEQQIGLIKPLAWARLLQHAKLIATSGARSKLSPAGLKALGLAPQSTIRTLWQKWLGNTTCDEFNRVNDIKGQQSAKSHMTTKPPRRDAIVEALLDCPPGQWISVDVLSSFMVATGREFLISHAPERLYLCEARYGNFGYSGYGGWPILQFRYLLVLLFEYAATLGLIDVAYVHPENARNDFHHQWGADDMNWLSRYDGLRAFRINPLGAYVLGMADDFQPSRPASSLTLALSPELGIRVISGQPTPADRMMLETWAQPAGTLRWRLDAERTLQAVERGRSTGEFIAFLAACGVPVLPQAVESFLRDVANDGTALRRIGNALTFDCRDAETAGHLSSLKELRNLCFRMGERGLAVPVEHETKFRRVVREHGLGIV